MRCHSQRQEFILSKSTNGHRWLNTGLLSVVLLYTVAVTTSCLPSPASSPGSVNITLYGFSIMKEVMEKAIYPNFSRQLKEEHGQDVVFASSFAGSETITNQILQGAAAQVAILASERDANRLHAGSAVTTDRHQLPHQGIINKTPFIILVRGGNPKGIRDFV